MKFLKLLITTTILVPFLSHSADYYVANSGTNALGGGQGLSTGLPWQTIQFAISQSTTGDTIHIAAGQYPEQLGITHSLTLTGADTLNSPKGFDRHDSQTIIYPPTNFVPGTSVITLFTNNIAIQNLTVHGDGSSNGVADLPAAIWASEIPFSVSSCAVHTVTTYGILGLTTNSFESNTDAQRSYIGYTSISNVVHPSGIFSAGLFLEKTPATIEHNTFHTITGTTANAGMYIHRCQFTTNMSLPLLVQDNCFDTVNLSIWANRFGAAAEPIWIRGNEITNGVFGIRVTSARAQSIISNNTIHVSGDLNGGSPAIGMWVHADYDPWNTNNTLRATDHQVLNNRVTGSANSPDGTIGMLFAYDTLTATNINNGLHASASENEVSGFDFGVGVESGTNMVDKPADPLVVVNLNNNDIYGNITSDIYYIGQTNVLDVSNNWFGPFGPNNLIGPITAFPWQLGQPGVDTDGDSLNDDLDPDDDNDGRLDIEEAIIGSGTTVSNAVPFGIESTIPSGTNTIVCWPSYQGRVYDLYRSTNLLAGFTRVLDDAPATPPLNCYTDNVSSAFYRLEVALP